MAVRSAVYVSAGSNIEPVVNLRLACRELEQLFGALTLSSVYQSAAVGFDGPDFLNMVISFPSDEGWQEIDSKLSRVQQITGREDHAERFSSRTLDLDLLLYGDLVIDGPRVSLPRADITQYAFVLWPMAELAPELQHPVTGRTMHELWSDFDCRRQAMRQLGEIYQPTLRPPSTAIT